MLSHTVLLVTGAALLTGLLGALVFGSNGTAEDRRTRDQQKLLRALEAQRRIRDAQLMRQARRRGTPRVEAPPPRVEAPPDEVSEEPEAEQHTAERQRKREAQEQAAALKAEREAADEVEPVKPLAELPLYSWANRIDHDDQPARRST